MLELTDDIIERTAKAAGHGAVSYNTDEYQKAVAMKNYGDNVFNMRNLPGGTFAQSVIDSAIGTAGSLADFAGNPAGIGDWANNYVQSQEMNMGKKPSFDFSWDYFMNGLPRDTGNLIGSMVGFGVPVGAAAVAAPYLGVSSGAAAAGGALLGAGLESGAEGGSKLREALERGESLDTAQDKALEVFGKDAGLLGVTNLAGLGALRKAYKGVKNAFQAGRASAAGEAVANPSRAVEFAKGAGLTTANLAIEGGQEALQQGIQDSVEPGKEYGILPWNWNDEQNEQFKATIVPMGLLGAFGGATRVGARKVGEWFSPDKLEQAELNTDTAENNIGNTVPSQANYTIANEVSDANLSQGTESKLRMLDEAYYKQYGQHLYVTSMTRHWGTNSDHETGSAFDVADDGLANDSERRRWIEEKARQLGLNPLDEYENPSSGATGGHMHFSDKGGAVNVDTSGWSGNADIDSLIADTANRYGIDPNLLAAIAEQESGFNQGAKSEAGALGIMQLMPDTANGLGVDATDLAGNIEGGAKYIKQMLDQFGGDVHKALEAYNGGPGNVGIAQTMKYADEVLQRYEKFKAKSAGTFSWSNPAEAKTSPTDYMKIMSDNNVTADTAGDFLQYVQLLAEDDANANNEQVQKDGAKAVKAIADGSPDVMERVAKELGYGQVKQEAEQKAPNIPMPKIRQHVQQNGWVEIGNKKDADEFAKTDYGKTLERVSNTKFVSPDFNAITGKVEQRTAQPQQVAQPAPQPTVQNKVQSDVASTNGQNIANNASAANNATVGNLLSSIPNSAISLAKTLSQNPAAISYNGNNVDLNKLNNAIKNNDIKTINGFNAHMMNNMRKNNVSLDDVVKEHLPVAKDTAMRLSKIPEAIAGAAGNRVDLRALQEAINNNDLSRINAISEKMAENLRSNGVSPYLAMRDTESVEEAPTGSILPAVQGNRAPSTDVQDLGWRVEGEVESPITPSAPYTEAQLEAPVIESERDTLTSREFLGKLNSVERQFMEYLDSVFDNTGVAFVDIMQHLNSQRNSLLGKAIEMFKNGYAVDSVVFSRMNDTQRSALVNYRRMLDVYGNSLTNADRDVIDEFTRLDNIINKYLAPMAHNYLINNNVLNYRGIDNAIKGLEGIAAKAREYEQIKVSEGYREGRATGNKVVPREDEEAISGSATAWGNVLHQTQKRGLPAETEGTKVQRFIKTLPNKIVQKSHSNSLNAMTNYAGEKITKAERVERVIKNGDSIQKIGNEYFVVAPSGNIKVTKSEYNYYNYLLNERKNDKSDNGSKEYAGTSRETAYEGRKALTEGDYKRGDVSVPENASSDEIGNLDIKTDGLKEFPDSNVLGKTKSTVITDDGKEFNVVYKVMSADDVVASNLPTDGLPVNSKYPSAMQPRNRQRVAMQEQITGMSNNLRPADLAESRNLNQGAPVIKSDGAVLNGNGRTIAIQKAWLNGKADKYKQYLLDNAEKLGINPADIEKIEHPILVRVVQDKLSKDDIMSMINSTTGGQRMSPSEQAKVDSGKIKSSTLNQYVAGSDLTSAANRNFLRDVLADIISPSERNAYYSKEGAINQDGVLRAQRALFALAYGDDTLLDAFSEAVNEEAKNFSNALKANAPLIARLQQLIKTGNATDLGLQKNLVSAVKALKEAVIAGKPAKSIWQEMSMFEDTEHSPETIAIARAMDGYRRSGKKLTQFVRNLAELGLKHGNPNQSGLFGEDEAPQVKLTDDIATAKEYVDTGNQMDMFAQKYSRDKNVDNKGNVEDNKSKEKTPRAIDDYSALEKEEKSIVDKAVQERANALFNRIVSYVQSGFDDNFSEADSKLSKNALLQDGRRNNVLEHLLQYANRYAEKPSNYKDVLNNLIPGFKTAGKSKEELVKAYNLYRDVAREMLNYGQYVYSELCERLAGRAGQSYRASTWTDIDRSASESRQFDRTEDATKAIVELLRGQETIRFNTEHSEKNSRNAFSFANPDTAEELKSTGNIDTPLDRLPKLPASKLRDSERKMQAFGKAIGVPVHFVNHPDKGYRGVFTHNGEVYINRNATVPAKAIFLHEFTHWLKASGKENRAVFDALAACVERDGGLFHERRLKQYRDRIFGGEQMTDEEIIEEIICDAMGNSKTAERISKAIDNFAPELNQSIWGRIKAMWDKFCKMVGFRQELSSKKQSLPNGLSQQEMARFNAQLNILMSKMRTTDGKPMFKVENYQLVVAENGKRPAEIFDINNINDYTPTYNIPAMPSSYSYQVHTQREAVRQQYEGTKEWMKAPNGEPTNLTEEQWLDVRTPNFKAWFGDWENNPENASKVVDENGEPLVVYHGRNSKLENDTIRTEGMRTTAGTGAWFSSKENISAQYGDNIYPCFLNIRSPYTADLKGAPAGEFSKAIAYDVDTNEEVKVAFDNGDGSAFKEMDTYITGDLKDINYEKYDIREEVYDTDSLVREVRNDKNVDGVVIKNVSDIPEGDTTDSVDYDNLPVADDYVVFNSNQIKSATENTGAFSPDTNNIKYSRPDTETARLDNEYMSLVDEFNNAESDEKKQAAHDKLVKLVEQAAEKAGFKNAIPEQVRAYKIRTKAAPKKTLKVYKVFTVDENGRPSALFVSSKDTLPQGVWLDAQDTYHFPYTNDKGKTSYYVPSTKNPNSKGGATGSSIVIQSEEILQELREMGYAGPTTDVGKKITALAYRPGWHAGTLPFFPQGGMKVTNPDYKGKDDLEHAQFVDTPYPNIHRYNQVVFECEMAFDKDYNEAAQATEDGDLEYMPTDGAYYFATNPLTRANPELGAWVISGSLKIGRALTQEECDKILTENGMPTQQWEGGYIRKGTEAERQAAIDRHFEEKYAKLDAKGKRSYPEFKDRETYQAWYDKQLPKQMLKREEMAKYGFYYQRDDNGNIKTDKDGNYKTSSPKKQPTLPRKINAMASGYGYESGKLDLASLGYTGEENDAARKTLAPITYDDNGNVIPLSQRFDVTNPDVRYSRDKAGVTKSTSDSIIPNAIRKLASRVHGYFFTPELPNNVTAKERREQQQIGVFEDEFSSPSRIAEHLPKLFGPYIEAGLKAQERQEKLRAKFLNDMNEVSKLLGYKKYRRKSAEYKKRLQDFNKVMLAGDLDQCVYTDEELREQGLDENTIKAYHKMRSILDEAWEMVNRTKEQLKFKTEIYKNEAVAEADIAVKKKDNPFIEVYKKSVNDKGELVYTTKEPKVFKVNNITVTGDELKNLKANKNVYITSEKHISGSNPSDLTYSVSYYQKNNGLGKIKGYIPHVFHEWQIMEADKDGNVLHDGDNPRIIKTYSSRGEAFNAGIKLGDENKDKHFVIMPKIHEVPGASERAAIMGDYDYNKTLVKIAESMKVSTADAKRIMADTISKKNKRRFLGYTMKRKGVKGYEDNVMLATYMYLNQASRYVALDPFKQNCINMYNRMFGSFDDASLLEKSPNASFIHSYINDVNGVPSRIETKLNQIFNKIPFMKGIAGGRASIWFFNTFFTYPMTIMKLGVLNPGSALLNMTQLFNLFGAMGENVASKEAYQRLIRKGFIDAKKGITDKNSALGKLLWDDLGLEEQIGADIAGGYSRAELSGVAAISNGIGRLAGDSMYLFRLSDTYTRAVTLLTAYNKALDEGKGKQEAIEYAKRINRKVNFDYSIADTPRFLRRLGPLGNVIFQFKKYPIKQLELFKDIYDDGRALGLNRKRSYARLLKYMTPYFAMSGFVGGFPFISTIGGVFAFFFLDDDDDWKQVLTQYMFETFGEDNPITLWFLYGAGAFVGMNIGSRVGVGDFLGVESRPKNTMETIMSMTTLTSTIMQTYKQASYGNYAEAIKAINPAVGNVIIGAKGEVRTTRGRMKYQYQNAYEQALRIIGLNPLNETMAGDIASNDYANKQAEKRAKDDAIDAFIEEPTAENAARLNELGVTPKSIKTEMARRKMNRAELNRLAEEEKAAKAKKSKQKKKQYSVNDYLKGK